MERLLQKLNSVQKMPPDLTDFLQSKVRPETFKKKTWLARQGQTCRKVYFIDEGLVRHVTIQNGREYTPWLLKEGNFVTSVKSFLNQVPATDGIVAIEDTAVFYLTYQHLEEGCRLHPELKVIKEKIISFYYDLKEDRDQRLGLMDRRERYLHLLKTDPDLVARTPVEILSSYLQMSSKKLFEIRRHASGLL